MDLYLEGQANNLRLKFLRLIGKENIVIVATENKINKLECLRVDTGNIEVDKNLNGFTKVITAYKRETIIEVK